MARILLVDDEGNIIRLLSSMLQVVGRHEVFTATDGVQGLQAVRAREIDLMISDIRMAPMNGIQLLRQARKIRPEMPVIFVTAYATIESAIEAYDLGAFDYIAKPFKVDELMESVNMALAFRESKRVGGRADSADIKIEYGLPGVVAASILMKNVCDLVMQFASWDMPVLITGPVGAGRRTIATGIHNCSDRNGMSVVYLNCREMSPPAIDSELFRPNGAFASCHGGTLVLGDADMLSPTIQARILAVMNEKAFKPAKGSGTVVTEFRLVGTTTLRSDDAARKGLFLADTARVPSRVTIEMSALRNRTDDILPLACHFLKKISGDKQPPVLSPRIRRMLTLYSWPGNVAELADVVGKLEPLARNGVIEADAIPPEIGSRFDSVSWLSETSGDSMPRGKNLVEYIRKKRRERLLKVMKEVGGDKRKAATALNISLAALDEQLGRLG